MATSYGYRNDERFIEDVHPPSDGNGFNVRQSHVQHQAIGALDDRYLRLRSFFGRAGVADDAVKIPVWVRHGYTRVPPLATLDALLLPDNPSSVPLMRTRFYLWRTWLRMQSLFAAINIRAQRTSRTTREALVTAALTLGAFVASIGTAIRHPSTLVAPQKYSAARGMYADWETGIWARLKWAILPAALVIALFFLLVVPLERSTTKHPTAPATTQGSHSHATTPQKSTTTHSGGASTKTGTTSTHTTAAPPTSTTTPTATPALDPPVPSLSPTSLTNPVTTPLTGGGSRTSTAPTSTSSPSSGSSSQTSPSGSSGSGSSGGSGGLLPTTGISVPPASVSVGGKPLVNTSGTSLTLN